MGRCLRRGVLPARCSPTGEGGKRRRAILFLVAAQGRRGPGWAAGRRSHVRAVSRPGGDGAKEIGGVLPNAATAPFRPADGLDFSPSQPDAADHGQSLSPRLQAAEPHAGTRTLGGVHSRSLSWGLVVNQIFRGRVEGVSRGGQMIKILGAPRSAGPGGTVEHSPMFQHWVTTPLMPVQQIISRSRRRMRPRAPEYGALQTLREYLHGWLPRGAFGVRSIPPLLEPRAISQC